MSVYDSIFRTVRSTTLLRRGMRSLVRVMPDMRVKKNVPLVGPLHFGLRRHHWLMGSNPFGGHAYNLAAFKRLCRDGEVAYDIGTNIGYYTRFILRHCRPSQLVCFEPMTANIRLLKRNLNEVDPRGQRSRLFELALDEADGDAELQVDDQADGSAVLSKVSGGEAAEGRRERGLDPLSEIVRTRRLDSLIADEGLPPPSFMKLDTEGAEIHVLRGATDTLREHRPRLMLAFHGNDRAREVVQLLEPLGYQVWGFLEKPNPTPADRRGDWTRITPEQCDHIGDNNCIASTNAEDVAPPLEPLALASLGI